MSRIQITGLAQISWNLPSLSTSCQLSALFWSKVFVKLRRPSRICWPSWPWILRKTLSCNWFWTLTQGDFESFLPKSCGYFLWCCFAQLPQLTLRYNSGVNTAPTWPFKNSGMLACFLFSLWRKKLDKVHQSTFSTLALCTQTSLNAMGKFLTELHSIKQFIKKSTMTQGVCVWDLSNLQILCLVSLWQV